MKINLYLIYFVYTQKGIPPKSKVTNGGPKNKTLFIFYDKGVKISMLPPHCLLYEKKHFTHINFQDGRRFIKMAAIYT